MKLLKNFFKTAALSLLTAVTLFNGVFATGNSEKYIPKIESADGEIQLELYKPETQLEENPIIEENNDSHLKTNCTYSTNYFKCLKNNKTSNKAEQCDYRYKTDSNGRKIGRASCRERV